jgi:flagellar protein FlaG
MSATIQPAAVVPLRPAPPVAAQAFRGGTGEAAKPGPPAPPGQPAASPVAAVVVEPPPVSYDPRERASRVVAELERLAPPNASLRFRVDAESQQIVVSVVDAETGDVLRQIPSEEALAIAKSLAETGTGIVSDKA